MKKTVDILKQLSEFDKEYKSHTSRYMQLFYNSKEKYWFFFAAKKSLIELINRIHESRLFFLAFPKPHKSKYITLVWLIFSELCQPVPAGCAVAVVIFDYCNLNWTVSCKQQLRYDKQNLFAQQNNIDK